MTDAVGLTSLLRRTIPADMSEQLVQELEMSDLRVQLASRRYELSGKPSSLKRALLQRLRQRSKNVLRQVGDQLEMAFATFLSFSLFANYRLPLRVCKHASCEVTNVVASVTDVKVEYSSYTCVI